MAVAALGLGAQNLGGALPTFGPKLADLMPGDVCTLTCAQTLGPC